MFTQLQRPRVAGEARQKPPHHLRNTYSGGELDGNGVRRFSSSTNSGPLRGNREAGWGVAASSLPTSTAHSSKSPPRRSSSQAASTFPAVAVVAPLPHPPPLSLAFSTTARVPPAGRLFFSPRSDAPLPIETRRDRAGGAAAAAAAAGGAASLPLPRPRWPLRGPPAGPVHAAQSSALAAVRSSHRLRHPEDALRLGGPVREASPCPAAAWDRHASAAAAADDSPAHSGVDSVSRRARRMRPSGPDTARQGYHSLSSPSCTAAAADEDHHNAKDASWKQRKPKERSFLPEDLAAREKAAQERLIRAEKRERHATKKAARAARLAKGRPHAAEGMTETAVQEDEDLVKDACDGTAAADKAEKRRLRELVAARAKAATASRGSCRGAGEEGVEAEEGGERGERSPAQAAEACDVSGPSLGSLSTLSDSLPSSIDSADDHSSEDAAGGGETAAERKGRLEREVMRHYSAMYARRTEAAAVIQRAWRCSRARLALYNRRQVLYHVAHTQQKAAAMCIVGLLKSRVLQRQRHAAVVAAREAACAREVHERAVVAAVRVLERALSRWMRQRREQQRLRHVLGLAKDARLQRYAAAAVVVQRWWRVVPEQHAYWQRRAREVAEQRQREAEADRQRHAATIIQKRVRGMLGRRYFYAYRLRHRQELAERQRRLEQCTQVVLLVLREFVLRQERLARESAAVDVRRDEAADIIQRGWKNALVRRRLCTALDEARRRRRSAVVLQRAWQRYAAGRELRYLRRLRETVEKDRWECELRVYRAACCLQRFARGVVLRQRHERLARAAYGRQALLALFTVQSVGRGYTTRRRLGDQRRERDRRARERAVLEAALRERSACLAQRLMADAAALFAAYHSAAVHEMDIAALRLGARAALADDASAGVIQRAARRWRAGRHAQTRKQQLARATGYVTAAVTCLQRWWRGMRARRLREEKAAQLRTATRKRLEWEDVLVSLLNDAEAEGMEGGMAITRASLWRAERPTAAAPAATRTGGGRSHWASLYEDEDDDD